MVVNRLSRTALAATSRNVLWADLGRNRPELATVPGRSRHIFNREAATIRANVSVAASPVGVVDLGSANAR